MAFALESARRGGRYVQIGLAGKPVRDPVRPRLLPRADGDGRLREHAVVVARALELIERAPVDLEPLLSEVVPLERWEQAFAATRAGEGIKFVLDP